MLVSAREPAHQLLVRAGARAGEPQNPPLDSSVSDCVCAAGAGVQRRLSWAQAARPDASSSRRGGSGHLGAEHVAVSLAAKTASAARLVDSLPGRSSSVPTINGVGVSQISGRCSAELC